MDLLGSGEAADPHGGHGHARVRGGPRVRRGEVWRGPRARCGGEVKGGPRKTA